MAKWGLWESVIRTDPLRAWRAGPPNGLVHERRKKGEERSDTALRVKIEDFDRLNAKAKPYVDMGRNYRPGAPDWPKNVPTPDVPTPDVPTSLSRHEEVVPNDGISDHGITTGLCADCGVKPREGRNKQCSACRKRSQRDG